MRNVRSMLITRDCLVTSPGCIATRSVGIQAGRARATTATASELAVRAGGIGAPVGIECHHGLALVVNSLMVRRQRAAGSAVRPDICTKIVSRSRRTGAAARGGRRRPLDMTTFSQRVPDTAPANAQLRRRYARTMPDRTCA